MLRRCVALAGISSALDIGRVREPVSKVLIRDCLGLTEACPGSDFGPISDHDIDAVKMRSVGCKGLSRRWYIPLRVATNSRKLTVVKVDEVLLSPHLTVRRVLVEDLVSDTMRLCICTIRTGKTYIDGELWKCLGSWISRIIPVPD
jgi:hypothetical protein